MNTANKATKKATRKKVNPDPATPSTSGTQQSAPTLAPTPAPTPGLPPGFDMAAIISAVTANVTAQLSAANNNPGATKSTKRKRAPPPPPEPESESEEDAEENESDEDDVPVQPPPKRAPRSKNKGKNKNILTPLDYDENDCMYTGQSYVDQAQQNLNLINTEPLQPPQDPVVPAVPSLAISQPLSSTPSYSSSSSISTSLSQDKLRIKYLEEKMALLEKEKARNNQPPKPVLDEAARDKEKIKILEEKLAIMEKSKNTILIKDAPSIPMRTVDMDRTAFLPPAMADKIQNYVHVRFADMVKEVYGTEAKKTIMVNSESDGSGSGIHFENKITRLFIDWDLWLEMYLIFQKCLADKHPEEYAGTCTYLDIIRKCRKEYGGWGWANYDEKFRRMKMWEHDLWAQGRYSRPPMAWDHVMDSLYNKCTQSAHSVDPVTGEDRPPKQVSHANPQNINQRKKKQPPPPSQPNNHHQNPNNQQQRSRQPVSKTHCRYFNGKGCSSTSCKWMHKCSSCNGKDHGATTCSNGQ